MPSTNPPTTPQNLLRTLVDNNFDIGGFDTRHEAARFVPHALYGEGLEGQPIYWEKTGFISSNFQEVKKVWNVDELVNAHVR